MYKSIHPVEGLTEWSCVPTQVEDVVKIYDTPKGLFHAVNNVSLDFTPGSIVVFLGPSGSG